MVGQGLHLKHYFITMETMKNKPFYFKLREDIQSELEALSQSSGHSCAELSEHAIMEFVYWNSWKA